ncbi:hypothetical protein M3J09_007243 [Ascochyta lentis]
MYSAASHIAKSNPDQYRGTSRGVILRSDMLGVEMLCLVSSEVTSVAHRSLGTSQDLGFVRSSMRGLASSTRNVHHQENAALSTSFRRRVAHIMRRAVVLLRPLSHRKTRHVFRAGLGCVISTPVYCWGGPCFVCCVLHALQATKLMPEFGLWV